MSALGNLLNSVAGMSVNQLRKKVYISPILNEEGDVNHGKFSLIYTEDLTIACGVSFVDNKRLYVYNLTEGEVLLDCSWDDVRKSWCVDEASGNPQVSEIIDFAKKMKELLS